MIHWTECVYSPTLAGSDRDGNPKYAEEEVTPSTGLLGVYFLLQVSGSLQTPPNVQIFFQRFVYPSVQFFLFDCPIHLTRSPALHSGV